MSVEGSLIPLGIAIYQALKHRREVAARQRAQAQTPVVEPVRAAVAPTVEEQAAAAGYVPTRFDATELVVRGLRQVGAVDITYDENAVSARVAGHWVTFTRWGDRLYGRLDEPTGQGTAQFLEELDVAIGRMLQTEQVERMRARAAQLGLVVVGEKVADNGTVQLVFEEAS